MSDLERQIGKNKLSTDGATYAYRCDFNGPTCNKPHGKRALGIKML